MPHDAEWHAARLRGIGGSNWSDLLGYKYGCPRKLWYEKRGVEPDFEPEETGPMRRGTLMEPIVLEEFERITGRKTRKVGAHRRMSMLPAWWIGHPDAGIVGSTDGMGPGILEAKTCNPWVFRKITQEGVREEDVAQCHHYLALTSRRWGVVVYLEPVSWQFHIASVEFDYSLCQTMIDAGSRFWVQVKNGPAPPQLDAKDDRCQRCAYRIGCQGDALYGSEMASSGDVEDLDDDSLRALMRDYDDIKEVADESEKLKKEKSAEIVAHLGGDPRTVAIDGRRLHLIQWSGNKIDKESLEADHPGLLEKYNKKSFGAVYMKAY